MGDLIGRESELADLRHWRDSGQPEFVAVYGRRRVGKTMLIREAFGGFAFYATGVLRARRADQLATWRDALADAGWPVDAPFTTWLDAFRALRKHLEAAIAARPGQRVVVFLDEIPWFDTRKSGFLAALDHFWNSWASARDEVMLVICGSATSWIVRKVFRDRGGLHNRVTRRIALQPFDLRQTKQLLEANGVVMTDYQIVEAYMVFGGIPFYLSLFDARLSLAQNINRLCFTPGGQLADEFDELYRSLFDNAGSHLAVVEALGTKNKGLTNADISNATGLAKGGTLSQVLAELELSGFVRSYVPPGRKAKGKLYQLIDTFSLFHLNFMRDRSNNDEAFWLKYLEGGGHNAWSGYAFEMVCLWHIPQIKAALGITGVIATVSGWRSETTDPSAQVYLVIARRDGVTNLCEMKYAATPYAITKDDSAALRRKRAAFAAETKTTDAIHLTMVTVQGITQNAYANDIQSQVTADDLFR